MVLAGLLTAGSLAFGAVASADTHAVIDRDDSLSPLDIAAVEHGHSDDALTFEVVTYEAWDETQTTGSVFLIRINLDSDRNSERLIVVRPEGDGLHARVYGARESEEGFRGDAVVSRPDDHSFLVEVEKTLIKKRLETFGWQVNSSVELTEPPCDGESGGCRDFVPGRKRYIRHDL